MPKRKLEIELIGDDKSLSAVFRGAGRNADTFGSRLRHAGVAGAKVLGGAVVAAAAAAAYGIAKTTAAAEESNKVHAQSAAVLKSTHHEANIAQKGVEGLAGAISRKTGIDDEQIQTGENLLLTFTQIRNEAGKGNDIFSQSTQTIVDMSAALGSDLKSSAIQVGKALNDPIKGITALQKVGVSFSEQKKEQIAQWVEEGDVLRAQKAILKELNTEFGGSAAAQATAMDKIKVGVGNVEESIGNVFLPLIDEAATNLNRDLVPELQHTADGLAAIAARKNISLSEKLDLGGDVIKRQWGDVPEEIGHLVDEAVPIVAERSGQIGVAAAEGMLHGFVHADPLGKAAILLFASKAFGGPAAVLGAGKQLGSKFGGAAATESALAMSTFGLGAGGTKAFGMIDKAKGVGKAVGKAGLAVGIVSGVAAGLEDADSPGQHVQNFLSGLTYKVVPEAAGSWANQIADGFMHDWDEQLPKVEKHIQGRALGALGKDRDKLVWTWKVAVATGASEERVDSLRHKIEALDHTISGIKNAGKNLDQGMSGLEGGKFTRLGDIKSVMAKDVQEIAGSTKKGSQEARDALAENFNAGAKAIEIGIDRGVIKTKTGMAEIAHLTRNAHLVSGDDPWGIAKGFQRSWEKSGTVTRQNLNHITNDLDKMPPAAAQVTGQMMIQMAQQMRSKGQLSKNEVEKLRSAVVTKLGLMAAQGGKKGEALELNLGGAFGGLSITTAEALENIGSNVSAVMKQLGAGQIPKFTLDYLQGHGAGGGKKYLDQVPEFKAQGGPVTVPGQGNRDTVPLFVNGAMSAVVAPGEKLAAITQHQSPLLDRAVYNEYGVAGLDGFFNTFDRPHHMAKGGLHEPHLHGPNPLRALGQAGVHKTFAAAEAYVRKHRPRATTSGVAGYSGPPASFSQLGDNAYVDSHTLAVTAYLDKKFGLTMSSGFRSVEHNAEIGGAPGSLHTHGSPANPGATDSVGSGSAMAAYIAYAKTHVAGLEEAMVDNYAGLGSNAHLGFFAMGGRIGRLAGLSSGGFAGDGYTVKGDAPTAQQQNTAKEIMEAADKTGAGHLARVAALMAAMQESDMGSTGNTFQLTGDFEGVSPSDSAYTQAVQWFTKGYYHGGGIGLSKKFSNPGDIAQEVEGSAYPDAYDPWKGEAQKWVDGWGGDGGDPGSGPASKSQEHTIGALQHRAAGVVREAQKLKAEYKKYGGTKRGKQALARTLKFSREAAAKAKAGNSDAAKKLIDKARDEIGKARDSYDKAAEGVYIPGLKPGHLPELGTDIFDPSQPFSANNLPGLGALPPELRKLLKAPGLDWSGKYGALDTTLSMAGLTDTKADDAAALNAMLGMDRKKREHLKKQLADLNKKLGKGGLTKAQSAKLVDQRNQVLSGLGEVAGNVGSIREQIGGLNEEAEVDAPTPHDFVDLEMARAESTKDKGDDVTALQHIEDLAKEELEQAKKSGDPREIAEATRNLTAAAEALREATPTAEDFASRDLALAELTADKGDDREALKKLLGIAEEELAAALATEDPRDDIEAAHKVKGLRDALESNEESTGDLKASIDELTKQIAHQNAIAESEVAISKNEAVRAVSDMLAGYLGQKTDHSAQVAGIGRVGTL